MPKSAPDPNLETVTDLVIEFRIRNVPGDAMERGDLTASMKPEINALKKIVVETHHGSATLTFRDRRQEKVSQGIGPATGTLTQEVAAELAAQPEEPTPVTTHRGRGVHQAAAE